MRYVLWVMMLAAACGGSESGDISGCDPCLSAPGARSGMSVDGDHITCSCAQGSGQQSYPLVLETTTICADNHAAWLAYSTANCH